MYCHVLQYFEESRKALQEQQEGGGGDAAAAAAAAAQPKTPGVTPAGRQLQNVLGSNVQQPSSGPAKIQRTH